MDKEIIAIEAHKRREQFIEIHSKSKLYELKIIWEMWKNDDFSSLGFETFEHYCEAPIESGGLDISRSYAIQLASVYQRFVKELGIKESEVMEIGPRKLYSVKDVVNEKNVDDIMNKAKSLSARDLRLDINNINPESCEHDWITIRRCRLCGRTEK